MILVSFVPKGATINSDVYIDTLQMLKARKKQRLRWTCPMFCCIMTMLNLKSASQSELNSSSDWTTIAHHHKIHIWHYQTSITWAPQKKFERVAFLHRCKGLTVLRNSLILQLVKF